MSDKAAGGQSLPRDQDPVPGRVSAIITCYNGERWIQRAVGSALAQSYPDREVIIVDDASIDGSAKILREYAQLPGVTLVVHDRNRGIPASKNSGLRHASGEFIAFLDQDDEWLEDKLEKQVAVLQGDPDVGLVHTGDVVVDPAGREFLRRKIDPVPSESRQEAVEAVFLRSPVRSMSSMAMPRHCLRSLGGFDEAFYGADDWDLCLRIAGRYKIKFIDEPLFRRQMHAGSSSRTGAHRMHKDGVRIIKKAVDTYPFLGRLERRRLSRSFVSWTVKCAQRGRFGEARRAAVAAVRNNPLSPKAHLALALALSGRAGLPLIRYWCRRARMREIEPGPLSGLASDRGKVLINLALALGAATMTPMALESGSYLFGTFDGPAQPLRVGNIQIYGQHDPLLFWSLRPGAEARGGSRWINSDGMRGPEIGPKGADEFRMLSLGESTTFAARMPYEHSYSARLERSLNTAPNGVEVRVLNGGVPGYSLFQGVQFLLHRAQRLEPDLVLLYFGYNDFLPVAYLTDRAGGRGSGAAGLNDWDLFERRKRLAGRLTSFLAANSNFYRGMLQLLSSDSVTRIAIDPERPRVPEEHRRRLLDMARDYCTENGIQLVIIVPVYRDFEDHADLLRSFARDHGIVTVDLPALFPSRVTAPMASYFADPIHPDSGGHRLIAEAIDQVVAPLVPQVAGR